jgi:small subunit ribosomal protein S6
MSNTASTDIRQYELLYILQPNVEQTAMAELTNRLTQAITGQQGEILGTELWGKRNLAYTIQKYGTGHYVLHRFQMNPAGTAELDRLLRFNENVIRYLIMRDDE